MVEEDRQTERQKERKKRRRVLNQRALIPSLMLAPRGGKSGGGRVVCAVGKKSLRVGKKQCIYIPKEVH